MEAQRDTPAGEGWLRRVVRAVSRRAAEWATLGDAAPEQWKGRTMVTGDQIVEYFERVIAEDKLSGNAQGLKNAQIAAGYLMKAAEYAGDKETARRLHILAARAANYHEELTGN